MQQSNSELQDIIFSSGVSANRKAAEQLLQQQPSNEDLCCIIECSDLKTPAWEQLLKQNPTNKDLCYLIRFSDFGLPAWEQLLKQEPSNDDLRYLIEYTDFKTEAAEQLLRQNPSNHDLRNIIEYTDLKNVAGEWLLRQAPSNDDLRHIIDYSDLKTEAADRLFHEASSNEDLCYVIEYSNQKMQATEQLRKRLGVTEIINEPELIKSIAEHVLATPGEFNMDKWHCDTSHCLAGWAVMLNATAQKIEEQTDTETAACIAIPNYAHLFFSDNETVLNVLKQVAESSTN